MIFKILLSRSVQTPNSDKNWQTSCSLQTFVCNISRHLEFIMEQGHRVNWVSGLPVAGFPGRWVTGSLGHKMWHSSMSGPLSKANSANNGAHFCHATPKSVRTVSLQRALFRAPSRNYSFPASFSDFNFTSNLIIHWWKRNISFCDRE